MSKTQRSEYIGCMQVGRAELSVWVYTDDTGGNRRVTIDISDSCSSSFMHVPSGLVHELVELLRTADFMAGFMGGMTADEWAKFEADESSPDARELQAREGGAA